MNLFKLFRSSKANAKDTLIKDYQFALSCANACNLMLRAGSEDSPYKLGEAGVRIIVQDFGNYQPFVLGSNIQDWLRRAFNLSDLEANKAYKVLNMRAIQLIKTLATEERTRRLYGSASGL